MDKTLLKNATVITQDKTATVLERGDLLIAGDKIARVAAEIACEDAAVLDCTGKIVMPGLVDAHRHTWQALMRGVGADWNHAQYFTGVKKVLGPLFTPEDTYISCYAGALECLDAGITTLFDWFHNNNSPAHADAALQALRDAGIRAVFGFSGDAEGELPVSEKAMDYADMRRMRAQSFAGAGGLVSLALASRGPQFLCMDRVREELALAKELDVPVAMHVGDGLWGKSRPVAALYERGLLNERFTFIHCNTLADDEIDIIGGLGAAAAVCPEVELNMGHGFSAIPRLMRAGVAPGLGVDVCTSVPGDLFGSMRAALMGVRAVVNEEALQTGAEVDPLPLLAKDVLRFATMGGARACGLHAVTGSLEAGKQADITVLECRAPNLAPMAQPVGAVVEAAGVRNVDTVFVAGRMAKRNGALCGVDQANVLRQLETAAQRLFARANITSRAAWVPEVYGGKPE